MSDVVVVALITIGGNLVIAGITSVLQSRSLLHQIKVESEMSDQKLDAKLEKYQAVQNEKIDELSRRVEKHNQVVERTYGLETKVARHDEQIKTLFSNRN